jgi:hypothetical protein
MNSKSNGKSLKRQLNDALTRIQLLEKILEAQNQEHTEKFTNLVIERLSEFEINNDLIVFRSDLPPEVIEKVLVFMKEHYPIAKVLMLNENADLKTLNQKEVQSLFDKLEDWYDVIILPKEKKDAPT